MKNFIQKIPLKEMIWAGIGIVCLLIFAIITLLEGMAKEKLYDQQAADRWSKEGGVSQISSFFAETEVEDPGFFLGVANSINKALQEASIVSENENVRLWVDAVSREGTVTLMNGSKKVELAAIGVRGDFFQFHPLNLQTGSLFTADTFLTDGIVIDEETAWQLFGSSDVAGMEVMIGQVPHYVAGVIEKDAGRIAQAAGLKKSVCYLSLESLLAYGVSEGGYCYELILPDPVDGFALSTVNKAVEAEKREVQVVENTDRYGVMSLFQVLKNFGTRSMSTQNIIFPYWENIARGYEDILALSLLLKMALLCFPCIWVVRAAVLLWKKKTWTVESGYRWVSDKIYDYEVRHPRKKITIKKGYVYTVGAIASAVILVVTVIVVSDRMGRNEGSGENTGDREVAAATTGTSRDFVYRQEDIRYQTDEGYVNQFFLVGDTIYVEEVIYETPEDNDKTEETEEDGTAQAALEVIEAEAVAPGAVAVESVVVVEEAVGTPGEGTMPNVIRVITGFDLDGNQKSQVRITMPPNSGAGAITADTQGNIYHIRNQYATYVGEDMQDKFYLEAYSAAGEQLFQIYLNENTDQETYFYVNSLYCIDDSKLLLESSQGILVFDLQGNRIKEISTEGQDSFRLLQLRNGQLALGRNNGEDFILQTLDPETEELGEEQELPFVYYEYSIFAGKAYDLYLVDNAGIYGFNLGDSEPTMIMDFLASDFSTHGMNKLVVVDETTFIAQCYTNEGELLARFTKVDPEDVKEKTQLVLGCYYLNMDVKQMVVDFNKRSQTHRIHVVEYSKYNTEDDYEQGMARLNADIVSGNPPDILLLQSGMPVDSYIAQGVFADYYELMEQDDGFDREDYLPNILEALSTNDKLYQIVPTFNVSTYVGKTADVGDRTGWTMEEAIALLESKPEGTRLFQWMTQQSFLYNLMYISAEEYVSWETGECFFDTDQFIAMLEFAKTLPEEVKYEGDMTQSDMEQEYTQFRDGRTILADSHLSTFRDYGQWKYATFGEDISMIGFPTGSGMGSAITYDYNLAISEESENKAAAWEFVKIFLEEEYQDKISHGFPIRLSSLEKLEERAWEKPYYLDENGKKVEYEDSYYLGDQEIKAEPLTREETQEVIDFLTGINRIVGYDSSLINIVTEEAALFFAGEKSAEEAAKIIQSRAEIYVNENR